VQSIQSIFQHSKPLLVGVRSFMRIAKHIILCVICTTSACNEATIMLTISYKFKEFQDVFEKKNVDVF